MYEECYAYVLVEDEKWWKHRSVRSKIGALRALNAETGIKKMRNGCRYIGREISSQIA